jgi:hypothetical protein
VADVPLPHAVAHAPARGRVGVSVKAALSVALVVGLIAWGCGAQKRLRTNTCDAHRHGAALVSRYLVVYGERTAAPTVTAYWVCLRPAGKAIPIGLDQPGSVYGSDATTGSFRAAGTYVAAQSSTGEVTMAVCARYNDVRRCPRARRWLTVVNANDGRATRIQLYGSLSLPAIVPFPVVLALSPNGVVAWLQNRTVGADVTGSLQLWATTLIPRGRSGFAVAPTLIDAGAIDPSSVRVERHVLQWSRDRRQYRRELR